MAASVSTLVLADPILNAFNSNTSHTLSGDSFQQPSAFNTISSYKWLIGTSVFLLIASLQALHYFFIQDAPPKGLKKLPGPRSTIPWLGRTHDVDITAPWFAWFKFANAYGGICASTICGETHVWIGNQSLAAELLVKKANIYSSRPAIPCIPGSDTEGQYLPLLTINDHWRKQRRFAQIMLTAARNAKFYGYITHEAKRFLFKLLNDPQDAHALTDRFCGRIAARMGYGRPDSAAAHCKNAGEFIPQLGPAGPITNLLPFLIHAPEWLNPSIKAVRNRREKEEKLWRGLMHQVKREMELGTAPLSYARTYLEQKKKDQAAGSEQAFEFDDEEAIHAVGMLVTVAIFTIGAPLYTFMLAMVLFPEWQEKVREEIDRVVGDRVVVVTDSPQLPTLRAVIKECLRWRPTVPLGVPRALDRDDSWNGYFIPKGAIVHAVDLAMARDPTLYPDPESFNPNRWLDPDYPTYRTPLTEHPRLMGMHSFGMGRRSCPGVETSEAELLVSCGSLVGVFELRPVKDPQTGLDILPPDWDHTSDVIGGPMPFDMDLRPRSEHHARRVRRDYLESLEHERDENVAPMIPMSFDPSITAAPPRMP